MAEQNYGKILFYSEATGDGIIVTREKQKIPFVISQWDDFDNLPEMGISVRFLIDDGYAIKIEVIEHDNIIENIDTIGESTAIANSETVTPKGVIDDYFGSVFQSLRPYRYFNDAQYGIDFTILRRFLLTTYNNLIEIDRDLYQTELTNIHKHLLILSDIYDGFKQKSKFVNQAFHELFLNRHHEYSAARNKLESNLESIGRYEVLVRIAETAMKKLLHILEKTPSNSLNYPIIQKKLKSARAKVSDAIHNKRELEEENFQLAQFLEVIVQENEENFREIFMTQAKVFDQKIVLLLNKAAYVFDVELWQKARKSKQIRNYFKRSNIKGQLTSFTYLKYYLQSLNSEKLSDEHKALFKIIPYLQSLQHRSLLYLSADIDNAMRLKSTVTALNKMIEIETTLDYDTALSRIIKKTPDFLFVDKNAEFMKLIKMLNELDILSEMYIVLVVENTNEKLLEKAKKLNIQSFLPTKVVSAVYIESIRNIIED